MDRKWNMAPNCSVLEPVLEEVDWLDPPIPKIRKNCSKSGLGDDLEYVFIPGYPGEVDVPEETFLKNNVEKNLSRTASDSRIPSVHRTGGPSKNLPTRPQDRSLKAPVVEAARHHHSLKSCPPNRQWVGSPLTESVKLASARNERPQSQAVADGDGVIKCPMCIQWGFRSISLYNEQYFFHPEDMEQCNASTNHGVESEVHGHDSESTESDEEWDDIGNVDLEETPSVPHNSKRLVNARLSHLARSSSLMVQSHLNIYRSIVNRRKKG